MSTRTNSGYKATEPDHADNPDFSEEGTAISSHHAISITPYLILIVFIATLGPFQFGYHLGELNAPQRVITCQVEPAIHSIPSRWLRLAPCIPMSEAAWGFVQSAYTIGGLIGSLIAGPCATIHGRRFSMQLLTLVLTVGPFVQALASSVGFLGFGRLLSGVGAGAATVVCPIFIAEVVPLDRRGFFGAFTQVMVNTGILASQAIGYFLSQGQQWRIILATAGVVSFLNLVALFTMIPETPKWLVENRQLSLAESNLKRIRGDDANLKDEVQSWAISALPEEQPLLGQAMPEARRASGASFVDAILVAKYRRAVYGLMAVFAAQQLCGINSVAMYSVAVLSSILPAAASLITVMLSALNVLITVLCAPLADNIGRKRCLLLSIAGMGINSILLVFGLSRNIAALTVTAFVLFVCSFGVGLGPVPFILASELVGPEAVGATSSWGLATSWISTFCVAQFFPMVNAALPRGYSYFVFAGAALALGSFVAYWLPESKGKATPEEVWVASSA